MSGAAPIADHWATGDVYALIISALEASSKSLDSLTVEDLAPVDHFHARGFPATVELGDRLPIEPGDHILDIGCGLGGPARYFAQRFKCRVSGIDITQPFVAARAEREGRDRARRRAEAPLRRPRLRRRLQPARDDECRRPPAFLR